MNGLKAVVRGIIPFLLISELALVTTPGALDGAIGYVPGISLLAVPVVGPPALVGGAIIGALLGAIPAKPHRSQTWPALLALVGVGLGLALWKAADSPIMLAVIPVLSWTFWRSGRAFVKQTVDRSPATDRPFAASTMSAAPAHPELMTTTAGVVGSGSARASSAGAGAVVQERTEIAAPAGTTAQERTQGWWRLGIGATLVVLLIGAMLIGPAQNYLETRADDALRQRTSDETWDVLATAGLELGRPASAGRAHEEICAPGTASYNEVGRVLNTPNAADQVERLLRALEIHGFDGEFRRYNIEGRPLATLVVIAAVKDDVFVDARITGTPRGGELEFRLILGSCVRDHREALKTSAFSRF